MRELKLLEVSVVIDDETGIYVIGELEYGVSTRTDDWIANDANRNRMTTFLRWLADQCETRQQPFPEVKP